MTVSNIKTKQIARYRENPFVIDMPIRNKKTHTEISPLGDKGNVAIIDTDSGEVLGSSIVTHHKVDRSKFVKFFTSQIGLSFNLSSAANKAFQILMWQAQKRPNETMVELSQWTLEEFVDENFKIATDQSNVFGFQPEMFEQDRADAGHRMKLKGYSIAVFRKGLSELVKNQIIANSTKLGSYHLNPAMIFNGNRISYTHVVDLVETPAEQGLLGND